MAGQVGILQVSHLRRHQQLREHLPRRQRPRSPGGRGHPLQSEHGGVAARRSAACAIRVTSRPRFTHLRLGRAMEASPLTPRWHCTATDSSRPTVLAKDNRLSRAEALRLSTRGAAWFINAETELGTIAPGHLADFVLLDRDYFAIEEAQIKSIASVLTVVDGRVVCGAQDYHRLGHRSNTSAAIRKFSKFTMTWRTRTSHALRAPRLPAPPMSFLRPGFAFAHERRRMVHPVRCPVDGLSDSDWRKPRSEAAALN